MSTLSGKHERHDSSYELRRFKALDASPLVVNWTRQHGIRIPYRMNGRRRYYEPDILIEYKDGSVYLEEVKGHVFVRLGFGLKNMAALAHCALRGWTFRIVFEEGLETVS